jgi:adenylate kinase family enzyme
VIHYTGLTTALVALPSAGKGTVIRNTQDLDHAIIGTGEYFRTQGQFKDLLDSGGLCPNDAVNEYIKGELVRTLGQNRILDGYPRGTEQAQYLLRLLSAQQHKLVVVFIKITPEIAIQRALNRAQIAIDSDEKPRGDDASPHERVKKHFKIVKETLGYLRYKAYGFYTINGLKSQESVAKEFRQIIKHEESELIISHSGQTVSNERMLMSA